MKQLTTIQIRKINKNLDYFFNIATNEQIKSGLMWYQNANNEANIIAKKYNLDVYKVSQVISALSPRNKWSQNIRDANKVCEAYVLGLHPEDIKVCTFHTNKFKAFNILANNVAITETSLKTFNFVNNIAYLNNDFLTIDIWHLRACFFKDIKINSASIGKIAYQQIKNITIKKANKLGLKGFELQAIIWLTAQTIFINNRKNK
tara:strand:- start:811 stop:1422 length:612 start_codon:yes stop_codon:yes gene_type:complete